MKERNYNYLWTGIIISSVIGTFFVINMAYANPLDLPEYAFSKPSIKEAYSFAKLEGDKLEGLPCNCGCAVYEFKRLWVWIVPLAIGFGTQIGIYLSIRHDATIKAGATTSGAISGGSMLACCSHYLLSIIPLIGITGLSTFTTFSMAYQKAFFSLGIVSSIAGIVLMLNHKSKMNGGCKINDN